MIDLAVWRVTTKRGYEIDVAPNEGVTTWRCGEHVQLHPTELLTDDWIRVRLGAGPFIAAPFDFQPPPPGSPQEMRYPTPSRMSDELGELLGLLVADGVIIFRAGKPRGFRVGKRYQSVVERVSQLTLLLFGRECVRAKMQGGSAAEFHSSYVTRWLIETFDGLLPRKKSVPAQIVDSPLSTQAAFMRGLFEDGTVNIKGGVVDFVALNQDNFETLRTVQQMLLRQNIVCSRRWAHGIGWLYIYSDHARTFSERIGFVSEEKNAKMAVFGKDRHCLIPLSRAELAVFDMSMKPSTRGNARNRLCISRTTAREVVDAVGASGAGVLPERMGWSYERPISVASINRAELIPQSA